jgi:TonB family protein
MKLFPAIFCVIFLGLCAALAEDNGTSTGSPGSHGDLVINLADADVKPSMTFNSPPFYPPQLRAAGVNVSAVIDFIVEADGRTSRIRVIRQTNEAFGAAARDGVSQWRFTPGRKNGEIVRVHMQVPIVFSVDRDNQRFGDDGSPPEADIGPGEAVVDISRVTAQPVAVFQARPAYPAELRANHVTGRVLVFFIVRTDGMVSNVRSVKATDPLFASSAVAAVRKWRFLPARLGGRAVNCQIEVPLIFSLNP